jgi:hypothetical protein
MTGHRREIPTAQATSVEANGYHAPLCGCATLAVAPTERISRMITLTTYKWVPDFAAPLMRAFRVRWALIATVCVPPLCALERRKAHTRTST